MTDPFEGQRLVGKVVVVTGSTQGLGAAIARRTVGLGAAGIVVCGRDRERGEAVRDEPALRVRLQPDRIRVNGLNIGWTATEGEHAVQTGEGMPADWQAAADAGRPLGRLLRSDDIAPMVTYLLSDAAQTGARPPVGGTPWA
jgi:NAD(P)-dependent dehydrogenase (short-subunit alcohol dehydrogenase family)